MDEYSIEDQVSDYGSGLLEDNTTLSCAASSLQANHTSPFPPDVDIAVRSVQVLFDIFRTILGIFLNGLVIFIVAKFKKLQNVSFSIAVQIALANVFLTISYCLVTINLIAGRWILGLNLCIIIGFVLLTFFYLRNSLILVFALDRFASVFIPFHYPKYSKKIVTLLCILFWCLSFANSLIIIPPILDCYHLINNSVLCSYSYRCSANCQVFQYVQILTHYVPTLLIPPVIFAALYIKGRKIRQQHNNMLGQNPIMTEEDWRALKTFSLLVTLAIIFTVAIIGDQAISYQFPQSSPVSKVFSVLYTFLVVADPIIILKNADVREVLGILVKSLKEKISRKPYNKD